MLKDNIKSMRKAKGLSQEELALKLNVVRQTVSKWEQGLSVPDAEMLISMSEVLDTSVNALLGESIPEKREDDLKVIAKKLEVINSQLAKQDRTRRKMAHWAMILLCIIIMIVFILLFLVNSFYLNWDFDDPEYAVLGTVIHSFEWLFVRVAPFVLIVSLVGVVLTRDKQ